MPAQQAEGVPSGGTASKASSTARATPPDQTSSGHPPLKEEGDQRKHLGGPSFSETKTGLSEPRFAYNIAILTPSVPASAPA